MTKLWIVGKKGEPYEQEDTPWEFIGVVDSEEKALAGCRDFRYFYAPAILNEILPDEPEEWPEFKYPHPWYREVVEERKADVD